MRTLIKITFTDVATTNQAFVDGSLQNTIESATKRLNPEAVYFYPADGCRSVIMICDLDDTAEMAAISETFFLPFNAKVDFTPVMNVDDLQKGMEEYKKLQQQPTT